ncbi:hypothetical protein [Desulfotruncus alcoholivorax]|uniref:hypothetical protein n=1 Tax=Desulfotruncus alcoholivorax TaxID=265477 RepID=UPI000423584B|nr:hypothetical protein [Desulfotruncus alcoholivorax]
MPIIEVNGPNPAVSIDGNKLTIQAFKLGDVQIPQKEWDLTKFQDYDEKTVRFYAGVDGQYHIDDNRDIFWLVAEVKLPGIKYKNAPTGEADENGQEVMEQVVVVPDMGQDAKIKVWALPDQGGNK